ncbi:MAG: hypothetical protein AB7F40_04485 [Victivallaceae bacterium]
MPKKIGKFVTSYGDDAKKQPANEDCKRAVLNIEEFDIEYLMSHKADYNPRAMAFDKKAGLSLCLSKFGYVENIIFNKRTERVVSGHQRIDVLYEQGYKRVQAVVVDLPEPLEKQLNIAMNASTITGDFTSSVSAILDDIMREDAEFFDMLNLGNLDILGDDEVEGNGSEPNEKDDSVPGMELLPYEHYDCLLVVFKNVDDWLYLASELGLNERRIISAPSVKNKKIGKVRAVSADKIIKLIRERSGDGLGLDDIGSDEDFGGDGI